MSVFVNCHVLRCWCGNDSCHFSAAYQPSNGNHMILHQDIATTLQERFNGEHYDLGKFLRDVDHLCVSSKLNVI